MVNKDLQLMKNCIDESAQELFYNDAKEYFSAEAQKLYKKTGSKFEYPFEYPLDSEVIERIKEIKDKIKDSDDDYEIFKFQDELGKLWKTLLSKSIKCLRFFDIREPFIKKIEENNGKSLFEINREKKPNAYGIDALAEYYEKYIKFERILYGSSKYYRDHIVHVFRTWLSGLYCMVKNDGEYLKCIWINSSDDKIDLNYCEKLSIWTIIALTHDLGYPLEKAKEIIDTTKSMVSTFITNPGISLDLSFRGVQNYMNDFIIRLISSKMVKSDKDVQDKRPFYARLQPKYYFKFQKSLERTEHGIISTLIIYKLLTYFLESDYNINEDYYFNEEERRQFYIRREILRSIASHTCKDIYHLYMGSFAFLLIVADDTQEWGRKYISELYVPSGQNYNLNDIKFTIASKPTSCNYCELTEEIILPEKLGKESVGSFIQRLRSQSIYYITIFRDGQDTTKRDFTFIKKCKVIYECNPKIIFDLTLEIKNNSKSTLTGYISYSSDGNTNKTFGEDFFKNLFNEEEKKGMDWKVLDKDGNQADLRKPATWDHGEVSFPLIC